MPPAVIEIALDPVLRLSETSSVRYETIGLAIVILLGLVLAARIASRTPSVAPFAPPPALRTDDLVFIVVGAVPGAIVGGRLGFVLDHLPFYQANPSAIFDPAQGGLTLTLAVPFGILTGGLIARLLGAPVRRWLQTAALPLLFVLAAGKLVGVLGGSGQGMLSDLPWATAYAGPGPWGSLAAELPAHPSQIYEALAIVAAILVLGLLSLVPAIRRPTGAALFLALGLWSLARFLVAFTWRDPAMVGPLLVEQALALGVAMASLAGLAVAWRAPVRTPAERLDPEDRRDAGSPADAETPADAGTPTDAEVRPV